MLFLDLEREYRLAVEHIRRYDAFFSRFAEAGISIFAYDQ